MTTDSRGPSGAATLLPFPGSRRRRRRRNWLIGISVSVLLVAALLAVVLYTPVLQITSITVQGNNLASSAVMDKALAPLKGRSLAHVSDADAERLLQDLAPIRDVEVAAEPPSTLHVTVREYVPVAVLKQDGEFLLIDEQGRILSTVKDQQAAGLPLIAGGTADVDSAVFSSVTAVLGALPEEVRSRLKQASAGTVDSIQLALADGRTVFWGSAEQNAEKARVLEALLKMPPSDSEAEVFDVSTPERPVTRSK